MSEKIVVRIPPSPTGYFHIGRARTALFNFLFAKKHGGEIVFRIEDTDKERSKKEYEEDIIESLAWLGITYDNGPFRQSERGDIYKKYVEQMIVDGTAYVSIEEGGENKEVIRFKNPNKQIVFDDMIRGEISFDTTDLKDFVIARNIDDPLYHLTVVVDDHEMGVTHVIRGEDGISNTPRQILLQEAIGATRPKYAHVPLLLAPDKTKMSARHGAVSLRDFKSNGYLPEAMVNYLALLGWNPGTEQEIFTMEELVDKFDIAQVQKGGAVFDEKKLRWVNREHLRKMSSADLHRVIADKLLNLLPGVEIPESVLELVSERIENYSDIDKLVREGELDWFTQEPELDNGKILWKDTSKTDTLRHLEKAVEIIAKSGDLMAYAEEAGKGSVLWPVRYALSGKEKSPDPLTLIKILGVDKSIERIKKAIEILK